jgi:hypothetical protein
MGFIESIGFWLAKAVVGKINVKPLDINNTS